MIKMDKIPCRCLSLFRKPGEMGFHSHQMGDLITYISFTETVGK